MEIQLDQQKRNLFSRILHRGTLKFSNSFLILMNFISNSVKVVFEAVPLVLDGHLEEVECMGNDGNVVASVCLSGVMKIWNATTGDNIVTVNRKR